MIELLEKIADSRFEVRRDAARALAKMTNAKIQSELDPDQYSKLCQAFDATWRSAISTIQKAPRDARVASEIKALALAMPVVSPSEVLQLLKAAQVSLSHLSELPESTKVAILKDFDKAEVIALRELADQDSSAFNAPTVAAEIDLCRVASVALYCRRGLEELVLLNFRASRVNARQAGPGLVVVRMGEEASQLRGGPFAFLSLNRFWHELGFVFSFSPSMTHDNLAQWIMRDVAPWLVPFGCRARFDWEESRSQNWRFAALLAQARSPLLNAPRQADWEIMIDQAAGRLVAKPRFKNFDLRFDWRQIGVPASSHAPLAAALVALAELKPNELVWDPFCGAGTELIEAALAQPLGSYIGSDIEDQAIAAAMHNARLAGTAIKWVQGDFRQVSGCDLVDAIVTNPPLGRRVAASDALDLADSLIDLAAVRLRPRTGRLVWVAPDRDRALRRAREAGLQVTRLKTVDLGGFDGEIQVLIKG